MQSPEGSVTVLSRVTCATMWTRLTCVVSRMLRNLCQCTIMCWQLWRQRSICHLTCVL